MTRYLLRRTGTALVVILGVSVVAFLLVTLLPGDPVRALFGFRRPTVGQVEEIRALLGLDDPLPLRYLRFLWGVVRFDPGRTAARSSVAAQLGPAIPATLRLISAAVALQLVLGVAGGAWSAWRRRGPAVWLLTAAAFASLSVPVFVTGTLAQCLLTDRTLGSLCSGRPEGALAFWVAAMLLALTALAGTLRLVRATVGISLRAGPGRLADALGIPPRRMVGVHALRPALVPVVELLAAQFSTLFTGAVIVEVIFDRAGIGRTLFAALRGREVVLAASIVTSVSVAVVLATLAADVLAAILDPRLRRAR